MASYSVPTTHNGSNAILFTNNDYDTTKSVYLKQTGGSLTGPVTSSSALTVSSLTASAMTLYGNIGLTSTLTTAPTAGQLGYTLPVVTLISATALTTATTINLTSISLTVGVWVINWSIECLNNNATSSVVTSFTGGIGHTASTTIFPSGMTLRCSQTLAQNNTFVVSNSAIITVTSALAPKTVFLNANLVWSGGVMVNGSSGATSISATRIA